MSYATLDDLKQRLGTSIYGKLTDRDAGTTADDDVGQEILDGAHGTVNSYLAKRFKVPVDVSSDTARAQFLRRHTLNVAEFDAWQGNPFRKDISERVKFSYQDSIKRLGDIAAGKSELPGATPIASATSTGPTATAIGNARIFTEDGLTGI